MKRKLSMAILIVTTLTLLPVISVQAKEPLIGTMDLQFDLDWFNDPGPHRPDWVGTITFEDDDHIYGMAFFVQGSGKPFATDPSTSIHFFEEEYVIYFDLTFKFNESGILTEFVPGDIALSGYDVGLTNMINSKYHMNGNVEVANGIFSEWIGRSVHMSGDILWYDFGPPRYAPGTCRIN